MVKYLVYDMMILYNELIYNGKTIHHTNITVDMGLHIYLLV